MKYLIFDAGSIISLTMNGLLPILDKLKQNFNGKFIITPDIKREIIDKPLKIKKYEFEAIKVKNLLNKGVLTLSSEIIPNDRVDKITIEVMKKANNCFEAKADRIRLIQKGEASCFAFALLCKSENLIATDERTARLLAESPEDLKRLMEKKLHTKLKLKKDSLNEFKKFRFIRSPELMYIAYKKNLFDLKKDKILLDALLYALKSKGAAISSREINEIKDMA